MAHIPQNLQVAIRRFLDRNPDGEGILLEAMEAPMNNASVSDFPGDTPYMPADSHYMDALLNAMADTQEGASRKKVIMFKFVWAIDRKGYEDNWTSNNADFIHWAEKKYRLILNGLMETKEKAGIVEPDVASQEFRNIFAERSSFDKARQEREKKMRW